MRSNRWLVLALVVSFGLLLIGRSKVSAKFAWKYPPLNTLVVTEYFSQDIAALTQGAHRVAADLAYVQLLQYYGDPENRVFHQSNEEEEEHFEGDGHDHDHHGHHGHASHSETSSKEFIRLLEFGRRILRLDPFFSRAFLDTAGALAFNHQRTGEALALLKESIELDPSYHRFRIYVAAILYRQEEQNDKLIEILDEAIKYPDCPVLLENILANLHQKVGNVFRAAEIYVHIVKTAADPKERESAQNQLVRLVQSYPYLADQIKPLLQQ